MKQLILILILLLFGLSSYSQSEKTLFLTFEIKDTSWTLVKDTVVEGIFYNQNGVSAIMMSTPTILIGDKLFRLKQLGKHGAFLKSTEIGNPYENLFDANGNKKESIIYVAKLQYMKNASTVELYNGSKKLKIFTLKSKFE